MLLSHAHTGELKLSEILSI